jgi:tetratricopeptide (TPR) repeat protein
LPVAGSRIGKYFKNFEKETMMKSNDFSLYIERYNAGEMDKMERIWFEKELDCNSDLRREVNLRKKTDQVLKDNDIIVLRDKLSSIESRRKEKGAAHVPVSRRILDFRYAAVFAGIILLGSITIFSGRHLSNDDIIKRYYNVYEFKFPSRSLSQASFSDFSVAVEYYNKHDFKNAALFFKKVLDSNPDEMPSTFLYGVSNFENSNYPEARHSFNNVIENRYNLFREDAQWYLALCYIKTDQREIAREKLLLIKDSESRYKRDAKKVLRKIR